MGNSGFKSDQKRDAAYGHGLRELEMRSDQGRERLRHEDECVEQVGWMVKSSPKATSAMDIIVEHDLCSHYSTRSSMTLAV